MATGDDPPLHSAVRVPSAALLCGVQRPPARLGDRAGWRFIDFFSANIRNSNTRRAYGRAVGDTGHQEAGQSR